METAQAQIDANGTVVRVGSAVQRSPYVGIRDRALETVERLGARLGIDTARAGEPTDASTRGRKLTKRRVSLALTAAGGVVGHAAKLLGVHRNNLTRWITDNPDIKDLKASLHEDMKDFSDTQLVTQMKAGNMTAIIWFQKRFGMAHMDRTDQPAANPTLSAGELERLAQNAEQLSDEQLAALNQFLGTITEGGGGSPGPGAGGDEAEGDFEVTGPMQ